MPDLLALVLVFWNVHQPRRVGVGVAFLFGLLMDVHEGALLGQHALAYTLLSYFAITIHRRLLWFTRAGAGAADPAAVLRRARWSSLVVRMVAGGMFPGWNLLLAPVFEALLWPVATWLLLAPQRRAARSGPESAAVSARRRMTELRNVEQRAVALPRALLAAARVRAVRASACSPRGWSTCRSCKHDELSTQAENNRIAVRADRAQPRPDRRPQRRRAGQQLLGLHAGDHAVARSADLEPLIDELAEVVDIQPRDRKRFKRLLEESKSFESLPIRTKLSDEEVARFTAQRFRFPGVDVKARLFRNYPLGEIGSHLLGYIGRINQAEKKAIDECARTRPTTAAPSTSASSASSRATRPSCTAPPASRRSRPAPAAAPVRRLKSNPATPGNTLVLSIDIQLQALVEEMFGERRGALVAIDPRSGEVLAFVSKPTFDPNLFVDGIDSETLARAQRVASTSRC